MRITLIISGLTRGGAERVLCILASAWAEQGKEVVILTLDQGGTPAYPIHPAVRLCSVDLLTESHHFLQGLVRNLRRIRVLRRAIRESNPDIVISFMDATNILTLLATRGLGIPVVVCEHVDPTHYGIGSVWDRLRKLVYPMADELICLTPATLSRFQAMMRVRGRVIPDPIAVPPGNLRAGHAGQDNAVSQRVLVGMGRLVHQKGFDLLLRAFAGISDRHCDWQLKIVGAGPLKNELEKQTQSLGLAEQVHFLGEVADPFPVLCAADLFVFSSRFEGFGLALCEAMACGLAVISFDCPSGPSDIIRDGVDGILVPAEDVAALTGAMDRLMSDPAERQRLASRAPEVLVRFNSDKILALWQQLFDDLLFAPSGKGTVASARSAKERSVGSDRT